MANKQFGDTLRELRNAKGYTQQQVADLLGLKNKSTLGSWEVGKSEPDGYTFLRLCRIYEVEDIYNAFAGIPPMQMPNDTTDIIQKLDMLAEDYRLIVENQIDFLLQMQRRKETVRKSS